MAIHDADNQSALSQLLAAAEQLTSADLGRFMAQLSALRAKREASVLPDSEAELIMAINHGLPIELQHRFHELIEKRLDNALSPAEHEEFMQINQQAEALNVKRITNLIALAEIRHSTLLAVMQQLGIAEASYVS